MYVISCLGGGLGNQLFQYAAGRSLAARTGAWLLVDGTRIKDPGGYRYVLSNLAIEAKLTFDLKLDRETSKVGIGTDDSANFPVFREHSFDYDSRFENLSVPTVLVGFWQSERYFESITGTILSECRLTSEPIGANARWLHTVNETNSVCVHVRRCDYLHPDIIKSHGPCSISYYLRAMEYVRSVTRAPKFFIFSDDRSWVSRNLLAPDAIVVDANGPEAADEELRLMSSCSHHIIANSTLSWWAAWLGQHESQIVIAPHPWFASGRPTPDLLPGRWMKFARD